MIQTYNAKTIKNRFKNSGYKLGYEFTIEKDGHEGICYGKGWNQLYLHSIYVAPDKIKYELSCATNARLDRILEIPFTEEFVIPIDFFDFITKHPMYIKK